MTAPKKLQTSILLERTRLRLGLEDETQARLVVAIVTERLGEQIEPGDRALLAGQLPAPLGEWLARADAAPVNSLLEFLDRLEADEGVPTGFALEHAQVVCETLTDVLDAEQVANLRSRLPAWIAALLVASPERLEARVGRAHGGHHLYDGRPGSAHPLAESAADTAQRDSVARSENPHGERKLASAPGVEPERRTLARGRPGSERPLSDYRGD